MFEYSQKPQTAQTVEMDADCGLSEQSSSLRRVSLRHELTQFYDRESSCDSLPMVCEGLTLLSVELHMDRNVGLQDIWC